MPDDPGRVGDQVTSRNPLEAARQAANLIATLLGRDVGEVLNALGISKPPRLDADRAKLLHEARKVLERRKKRTKYFSPAMFAEPAWDMLLVLYITDFTSVRLTVGRLADWVGAPNTTVLRWLDYLEEKGFIGKTRHPTDRRVVFVELLDKGRSVLDSYFEEVASDPTTRPTEV